MAMAHWYVVVSTGAKCLAGSQSVWRDPGVFGGIPEILLVEIDRDGALDPKNWALDPKIGIQEKIGIPKYLAGSQSAWRDPRVFGGIPELLLVGN